MSDYSVCGVPIEQIQSKMLDILLEVDRVCRKHHIRYVLDSGTLLGAVRHKGFIPWDDDIDIAMLREDYEKFCRIAPQELSAPYVFETMSSRKQYPNIFGKCYHTETRYVEADCAHLDVRHNIWLDIFPMDNVLPKTKHLQCRIVATLNTVRCLKLKTTAFSPRHIFYFPLFLLPLGTISRLAEQWMKKYSDRQTELVCPVCQSGTAKPMFRRELFTKTTEVPFEGHLLPIPVDYMEYLHGYYSEPMQLPPEKSRHPTHGVKEVKL